MKQQQDSNEVEQLASETILERGIKIKIAAPFFIKWFKKTISLRIYSPYQGTLLRLSSYYLATGIKDNQLDDVTVEETVALMAVHGKSISKAIAVAVLNGYWAIKIFTKPLAWYLRWHAKPKELFAIVTMLVVYGGTTDFMNTTRLVRRMKVTAPNLGQTPKES